MRCVQSRARLVRALYERLDRLEAALTADYDEPGSWCRGTATWTITWTAPALDDGGQFTETRATEFTVAVHEVQVVN